MRFFLYFLISSVYKRLLVLLQKVYALNIRKFIWKSGFRNRRATQCYWVISRPWLLDKQLCRYPVEPTVGPSPTGPNLSHERFQCEWSRWPSGHPCDVPCLETCPAFPALSTFRRSRISGCSRSRVRRQRAAEQCRMLRRRGRRCGHRERPPFRCWSRGRWRTGKITVANVVIGRNVQCNSRDTLRLALRLSLKLLLPPDRRKYAPAGPVVWVPRSCDYRLCNCVISSGYEFCSNRSIKSPVGLHTSQHLISDPCKYKEDKTIFNF